MAKVPSLDVFTRARRDGRRVVVLTAYDVATARLAARGGVDALLVGDSLGQVVLGHDSTLPVTMDDMCHHTRAVTRAGTGLPVIADLPYGSFHVDPRETVRAGLRLVQEGGAQAVKLEGGRQRQDHLAALLDAEIPVMGHLGLTPQSLHRFGGYKVQGRSEEAARRLLDEAAFLDEAGCFAMVLECIPAVLAARITASVGVPTIGIGAGVDCDGQVLVFHDLLGLLDDFQPKFVKRYADLGRGAVDAIAAFGDDVRRGAFPGPEHTYDRPASRSAEVEKRAGYLGGLADEAEPDEEDG
jgi:3-methyl-2-oxobutanoate hydroxymethyltransferase